MLALFTSADHGLIFHTNNLYIFNIMDKEILERERETKSYTNEYRQTDRSLIRYIN